MIFLTFRLYNITMDMIELRDGIVFEYEGKTFTVISAFHAHQQRGRGFVKVKAKEIKTGKTIEQVFRSDAKINAIFVEETVLTYLYRDSGNYYFMDNNTYEQVSLPENSLSEVKGFLKEDTEVTGLFHNGAILDIKLPISVALKVIEAESGFRGDTVQGGKKKLKLETGITIQGPLFIEEGNIVKVDTRTAEYIGVAKK